MITNIFITFLNMSISAGLVAALLIVWRQLTKRHIPPRFYCILWATILFRLVVPFSIKSDISLLNVLNSSHRYAQGTRYIVTMEYVDVADVHGRIMVNSFDLINLVSALWLAVFAAMILVWAVFFIRTDRKLQFAVLHKSDDVTRVKADFGIKRNIGVFKTHYDVSPMVLGFFRPKIIFSDRRNISSEDFRFALAHELVHIKRKDHFTKAIAYFALALHWYNPVIWICFYMMNEDMEKSCDEAVVRKYGTESKKQYASALINYADNTGRFQFGYISFAKKKVIQRVHNILAYEKLPFARIAVFALVTLTIGVTVTTNPVLANEYKYIPSTVYLSSSQRQQFDRLAQDFAQNVADRDVGAITRKATLDTDFFADAYQSFARDDIQLQMGDIFYTSPQTADVHYTMTSSKNVVFPKGTQHLVAQINHSDVMGGLYMESLHTYDTYNSFSLVDRDNEAVQIVDKMIKFDITSGENTPQNAEKIVAFCMDMAYDRARDKNTFFIPVLLQSISASSAQGLV